MPGLTVRLIRSSAELQAVYRLTYEAYLAEGYCVVRKGGRLIHYPYLDGIPETRVFGAFDEGGALIGTNSWTMDGPEGLHVDDDFHPEVEAIRTEILKAGLRPDQLAAGWRIAVQKSWRKNRVMILLVKATVRSMVKAGIEVALFSFAPKHELAYTHWLHMRTIAQHAELNAQNSPSVLMRLNRNEIPLSFIARKRKAPALGVTT